MVGLGNMFVAEGFPFCDIPILWQFDCSPEPATICILFEESGPAGTGSLPVNGCAVSYDCHEWVGYG